MPLKREIADSLPVNEVAPEVSRLLKESPRLVVTAPPGSGKSTLLPIVAMESIGREGKIIMLEPRRIAARQIAMRMADMLGEKVGQTVGYRIRLETCVSTSTRIEVITEGILERMLIADPTLDGCTAVIFDEYHERSLASDVALALTLRAQELVRPDLRVMIMSATIDAAYICSRLEAPLIEASGRIHPVKIIHLDDIEPRDAAAATARAVSIALREQKGDILAFLPGEAEIRQCIALLEERADGVTLFPLYGMLPPEQQRRALIPSRDGNRKVVVATPVAETSLTIEGVTTVVDSGFCRELRTDRQSSLSRLVTVAVSRDMADQRAGRAGRLSPGVCYRLWSRPAEAKMRERREPEILSADLAPMVLSVAAWGESDPESLPWITPPPHGDILQASALLRDLGAIDSRGVITDHGRRMSSLPCHPRIAAMLLSASDNATRALAADIAALLEEKDIISDDNDADINSRIALLRDRRRAKNIGRLRRVADIAAQYRRLVGAREDNGIPDCNESGRLIAAAYPERIALRGDDGRFRLPGGNFVALSPDDDLISCPLLAVASLSSRIFSAAPLAEADARRHARWIDNVSWDPRQGRIVARKELRIGVLVLDSRQLDKLSDEEAMKIICEAAVKEGHTMFDFDADCRRMQIRIATLAAWHPELELPDVSDDALLRDAGRWLPLYGGSARSVAELRKIDMAAAIWGLLSYEQQQAAERLAPERVKLPGGRSVRIDYRQGAEAPVVSARLQDCFGLLETPRLDNGRRPVLMELLSPGFKPVQLTSDMAGFWRSTYFEVRKELRRRYPKHRWPEDPLNPQ